MGLCSDAAVRLGYQPRAAFPERICFDDAAVLAAFDPSLRRILTTTIGNASSIGMVVHESGLNYQPADSSDSKHRLKQFQSSSAVLAADIREHERYLLEAAACGAPLIIVEGLSSTVISSYIKAGFGVDLVHLASVDPRTAAAATVGIVKQLCRNQNPALGEFFRRKVTSLHSASAWAIMDLGFDSQIDLGSLNDHQKAHPKSTDDYMWQGERLLIYALLSSLKPDGHVVEIGVGVGGTLGLLTAFSGGRSVWAVDNFSYQGEAQRHEFYATMSPWEGRYTIFEGNSDIVAVPDGGISFLHIDANHDFKPALGDLMRFASRIQPGGVLAVDDYMTAGDMPGVSAAVKAFFALSPFTWEPIACGPKIAFWRRTDDPGPGEVIQPDPTVGQPAESEVGAGLGDG